MAFNYLSLNHLLSFIVYVCLIIYVLYKNPRSSLNRVCALFISSFAVWSFSSIFARSANVKEVYSLWMSIGSTGWCSFGAFALWFFLVFTKKERILRIKIIYPLFFLIPLLFIYKQWTGYLMVDFIKIPYGWAPIWSKSIWAYLYHAYYLIFILIGLFLCLSFWRKTENESEKKQAKIIFISSITTFIIGWSTNVLLPELKIYIAPLIADVVFLVWAYGLVFAITRYGLMTITPSEAADNIISTMTDSLILINPDKQIIKINKAIQDLLGYNGEELIGQPIDAILKENSLFTGNRFLELIANEKIENYDLELKTKTGKFIPVSFSASVMYNKKKQIVGIVGVAKDLRQIKQLIYELQEERTALDRRVKERTGELESSKQELEKSKQELEEKVIALEKSEKETRLAYDSLAKLEKQIAREHEKIAAIISNFTDPIIFVNNEGRVSFINPVAQKILRLSRDTLGKKIAKKNNYSIENFAKIINRKMKFEDKSKRKSHNPKEEEVIIYYEGQELTYKIITAEVLGKRNKYLGVMKIFYNLTREAMIDKMKSEFISIAAHQLRTPLSAIKWTIKMVLDGDTGKINKDQRELLSKSYISNDRVINLINDMLNVSRIEEGRFGYSFSHADFQEILNIVLDSLKNQVENNELKFTLAIPKKLPKVYMDKRKMMLVLQNILENAVKYTPKRGEIKITVKAGKKFLTVKVKDNGVGIPAEDQPKLFSKFFRAANVMRMQTEGSGLGLFIVKNIVEKHGGKINYKSKEGEGTEFIFTLPLH